MSDADSKLEKANLRKIIRQRIRNVPTKKIAEGSVNICKKLSEKFASNLPPVLLAYRALPNEPDLTYFLQELILRGVATAFPRCEFGKLNFYFADVTKNDHFQTGTYGILEPSSTLVVVVPQELPEKSVVLIPGLAFTKNGSRIGRGAGYYDAFLKLIPSKILRLGIAFPWQIVQYIPEDPWDERVDEVIVSEGDWDL